MLQCFYNSRCTLRFPSTNIRLEFQSLVEESGVGSGGAGPPLPPLRISIPVDNDGRSPAPSPTGKKQLHSINIADIKSY